MPDLHFGTMGFSYADWSGVFYPDRIKPADYLPYYARHFDTVELDTTFHATPPPDRVLRWSEVTPDHFRFCAKAPKTVTHDGLDRRLPEIHEFLDVMRLFGPKLAIILLQLPPSCGIEQFDSIARLLQALPTDLRFAIEFRSASWGHQRTLDLLREHRCALVAAEYTTRPNQILLTTDFLYIRWIGEHQRFSELNHEQIDVTASLEWWKQQLTTLSPKLNTIWGFFNNDYSGYSIATSRRFMSMLGLPLTDLEPAEQGRLFS
jgi:uncharacterized protein YecE (DUF72 family)